MAGAWTAAEDDILRAAAAKSGKKSNWKEVSRLLPGRSNKSCRKRWVHSLNPALRRGRWTAAEDALLLSAIEAHGTFWWKVAMHVPGRTDDQCAKRWKEKLDPSISHAPWSPEEDQILLAAHESLGSQWNSVAAQLPGRPAVHCRNRFQSLQRSAASGSSKNADDPSSHLHSPVILEASTSRTTNERTYSYDFTGVNLHVPDNVITPNRSSGRKTMAFWPSIQPGLRKTRASLSTPCAPQAQPAHRIPSPLTLTTLQLARHSRPLRINRLSQPVPCGHT
ncbi:hypothetical protein DENSPDRAFT_274332 [Dentipellis sp. KUC8613]|nr:hypothetical protein DENSPDRAFT_274332 [Dentipellis sp. KUC8613]